MVSLFEPRYTCHSLVTKRGCVRMSADQAQAESSILFDFYKDEREQVRHHERQIALVAFQTLVAMGVLITASLHVPAAQESSTRWSLAVVAVLVCTLSGSASVLLQRVANKHVERARSVRSNLRELKRVESAGATHKWFVLFHVAFFGLVAVGTCFAIESVGSATSGSPAKKGEPEKTSTMRSESAKPLSADVKTSISASSKADSPPPTPTSSAGDLPTGSRRFVSETRDVVTMLGVVLALIQYWRTTRKHLHIGLSVDEGIEDGWFRISTEVQNRGEVARRVDYAMVLIGPEREDPLKTAEILLGREFECTNDFAEIEEMEAVQDASILQQEDRALIPLPFYFSENIDVGDEDLTYDVPVCANEFKHNTPYSARFFIFSKDHYHRSTQRMFVVPHTMSTDVARKSVATGWVAAEPNDCTCKKIGPTD